ncbi:MAG TPA: FKBP-type peptidyl-prolyl cis-trans isomerase [Rhizomicrobium sp.]|nr:FKBP-type peptidyl-prolyl cis-trans isomerase [Rhizomicrobium sp.]
MRPVILIVLALFCAAPAFAQAPAPTAAAAQAYLANNAKQPGVMVRPSGLQTRILRNGTGRRIAPGNGVQVYYTAKLINGTLIDGTTPGLPAPIEPAMTLKGLGEALSLMREGDRWEVTLPPILAFGAKGGGNGAIPPDQAIVFDLTVASVTATPVAAAGGSSNSFGFTSNNGQSRAYWVIRP